MELLLPFIQEFRLGAVQDPHTRRDVMLTERVTVCPACQRLHSLRHDHRHVHCIDCGWTTKEKVA